MMMQSLGELMSFLLRLRNSNLHFQSHLFIYPMLDISNTEHKDAPYETGHLRENLTLQQSVCRSSVRQSKLLVQSPWTSQAQHT